MFATGIPAYTDPASIKSAFIKFYKNAALMEIITSAVEGEMKRFGFDIELAESLQDNNQIKAKYALRCEALIRVLDFAGLKLNEELRNDLTRLIEDEEAYRPYCTSKIALSIHSWALGMSEIC